MRRDTRTLMTAKGLALGLLALGVSACTEEPVHYEAPEIDRSTDTVVASVQGTPIYLSDVARLAVGQERVSDPVEFTRDRQDFADVREEVINQRIMSLAARKRGLDLSEEARRRIAIAEERVLGNLLVETHLEEVVTDERLRTLYEQQLALREPVPQVRGAHLLVATEDEAKAARARIVAGEDFADVAADVSLDTVTAPTGGTLGWFTRKTFATPFTDAAFATEVGKLSPPVATEFGWHVITIEDMREDAPPTFESLREELSAFLTYDEIEQFVTTLRSAADVETYDADLEADKTNE